jgi:type II secretory pathway pseudopilin PulG
MHRMTQNEPERRGEGFGVQVAGGSNREPRVQGSGFRVLAAATRNQGFKVQVAGGRRQQPSTKHQEPSRPLCGGNAPIRVHSRAFAVSTTYHLPPNTYHLPPATCVPATPAAPPYHLNRRRAAFSLLELLTVITLIALLMAAIAIAAQYVVQATKDQRRDLTAKALEMAILNYRATYGQWPIDPSLTANGLPNPCTIGGTTNYLVFDMLRACSGTATNDYNPNNVPFLDISTLTSPDGAQLRSRHWFVTNGIVPPGLSIAYPLRNNDISNVGIGYFSVTFDFEQDAVTVTP